MIRCDFNNHLVKDDKAQKFIVIDERPENLYSQAIYKSIKSESHLTKIRCEMADIQGRCEYLLNGTRSDISINIVWKKSNSGVGFSINVPSDNYKPDWLLMNCVSRYMEILVGFNHFSDLKEKSLYLPPCPLEKERPARIELVLHYDENHELSDYLIRPINLENLGTYLSRAFEKYSDEFHTLKDITEPMPPPKKEKTEEEGEEKTKKRKGRKKSNPR